jgi:hypothetical protein
MPDDALSHSSLTDPLSPGDALILMALWHHENKPHATGQHSVGLTRDELAVALVGHGFSSSAALFRRMIRLNTSAFSKIVKIDEIRLLRAKRKNNAGRNGYRYSLRGGEVITWPCSARIALAVWDARGHHISQDTLLIDLEALRLRDDEGDQAMTRAAIKRDVDEFLIPKGYLIRQGDHLATLPRLTFEMEYLSEVSFQCFIGDPPKREIKPEPVPNG